MWEYFFSDFSAMQISILMVCAVLIGINKTGIPGIGTLPVVILAQTFPTHLSTGLQLMLLCTADLMAIAYYRRTGNFKLVFKLIPCAVIGLILGSVTMRYLHDERMLQIAIGSIILVMSALNLLKKYYFKSKTLIPNHWAFAVIIGAIAGFTTQIANAAGPVMGLYLLTLNLEKNEYIGTSVWFFMIVNWLKLPIFILQDRITLTAFHADLPMIPFLFLGAVIGVLFVKHLKQSVFEVIIEILIIISALRLVF